MTTQLKPGSNSFGMLEALTQLGLDALNVVSLGNVHDEVVVDVGVAVIVSAALHLAEMIGHLDVLLSITQSCRLWIYPRISIKI